MIIIQSVVAHICAFLVHGFGYTCSVVNSSTIHCNRFNLQIIEGCTGMHSMISLTVLTFILCITDKIKSLRAIILIISAPFIAFCGNIFRITSTCIICHYNYNFGMGIYHEFVGYPIFMMDLICIILLNNWIKRKLS